MQRGRGPIGLYVAAGVFGLVIVAIVASSLTRRAPRGYAPTPVAPRPPGDGFVSDTVTIDARDGTAWRLFDFEAGSVVADPDPAAWDLAVRRFHVVTNGGPSFAGRAGALAVPSPLRQVVEAPAEGYAATEGSLPGEPSNPALERWYRYSFFAHTLEPKDVSYVVRTSEGRYAKLRILSYYCPGAVAGCLTFAYAYQGDGSRRLAPADPVTARPPPPAPAR